MSKANRFGLPREIPDKVKREIRRRSKFACVICRAGIFDYEHIEPQYHDATIHDPENICCLCTACHAKVSRGHYSKAYVKEKYNEVQAANPSLLRPPFDQLDFHEGKAEIRLGGLAYGSGLTTIIKYHGVELVSISPTYLSDVVGINALFMDDDGNETLRISDNVWHGSLKAWDTEVIGPRIMVRKRKGQFSLKLRLEPPGKIIIEKLDMRVADAHILVSERSYALGRYHRDDKLFWFHASMVDMATPLPGAAAIEFLAYEEAESRDQQWNGRGQRLATEDNLFVLQTGLGVADKSLGIIVGSNCLDFAISELASGGPHSLSTMRRIVIKHPEQVCRYIGTGNLEQKDH